MASAARGKKEELPPDPLEEKINKAYAENPRDERVRNYIGASSIGHECDAFLLLGLRGFPSTDPLPRTRRIFDLGSTIEDMVVADLKKADMHVKEVNPATGEQWEWSLAGGHIVCHADGLVELKGSEWAVLEIKSMNKKYFTAFRKNGVLKSHAKYYHQAQMLMGMSGYRKTLFVVYCKDNSEYAHEVIDFVPELWDRTKLRLVGVSSGKAKRVGWNIDKWPCAWCFQKDSCWKDDPIPRECSLCTHSEPTDDGDWKCNRHSKPCTTACADWQRWRPESK